MKLKLGQVCIEKRKGEYECRFIPHNMSNQRMHWTKKKKWTDAWKQEVSGQVAIQRHNLKLPLYKAVITIVMYVVREMDYDGAYNAVKPILDGLKIDCAGVIVDDSPEYIDLVVKQQKVKHYLEQYVEITICK